MVSFPPAGDDGHPRHAGRACPAGRRASWPRPGRLASVFTRQPRTRQGERASTGWNDSPPTARVARPAEPGRAGLRSRVGIPLADSLIQSVPGSFTPRVTCRAAWGRS